ncbi:MAG: hypothetical protein A7316_01850 [Candidatus Altiarchaeales archaeon WOR_SM1_86-2]|nr:MAG: hypothetical protein A7316_01850 [Candidatus Altiarchaeales archaeon WOR_SM1_86-2]ODS38342.1 MAG: hypothetical protein A7315_12570 [Candidatus Altiarchaeales archaeon WOR_SM1_79]
MDMNKKKAYLDVSISACPGCGMLYADASWYAIELGADVECGKCGAEWNPGKHKTDRVLIEFALDNKGRVSDVGYKNLE